MAVKELVNTLALGHVGAQPEAGHAPPVAHLFRDAGDCAAARSQYHAATGLGEAFRNGAADPTAGAGYQRVLSLKVSISSHRAVRREKKGRSGTSIRNR